MTPLGQALTGLIGPAKDACRTPEDVDATTALLGRALTPEEKQDVARIKAELGKARAR